MVRHIRRADGAKENGVMWPQLFQTVIRHHLAMLAVKGRSPVERREIERKASVARSKRLQNSDTGFDDLRSDAVSGGALRCCNFSPE